ncbi:50S ribosomal protein L33 [Bacillus sp. FJAT-29814]|nr:50S ribosomal protein L33 [Bacillus sp. FJAT-29814]
MGKKVVLACETCGSRNYSTASSDTKQERLEIKKYCKTCGSHTIHKETK